MKQYTGWLLLSSVSLGSLGGCCGDMGHKEGQLGPSGSLYRLSGEEARFGDGQSSHHGSAPGQNQLGYFQYDRAVYGRQDRAPQLYVDRALLAEGLGRLLGELNNIKSSTVLVTDDYVFAGVTTDDGSDPSSDVYTNVQRVIESFTPRYYTVRILPEAQLRHTIDRVGIRNFGPNDLAGVKGDLEQAIRELGDLTPPHLNPIIEPGQRKDSLSQELKTEPQP